MFAAPFTAAMANYPFIVVHVEKTKSDFCSSCKRSHKALVLLSSFFGIVRFFPSFLVIISYWLQFPTTGTLFRDSPDPIFRCFGAYGAAPLFFVPNPASARSYYLLW